MARLNKKSVLGLILGALAVGALGVNVSVVVAQPAPGSSKRVALVIGEAAYKSGPLSSAANDAGMVADTLRLAGFDVTGAADLDQDGLRRALKEFVDKAGAAGPDGIAFVYLSGRAVQYAGDNYLAPVEAVIPRPSSVPLEAVRLSDYTRPLAEMPLKARIVVIDGARSNVFAQGGAPLAGGLALVDAEPGSLYAFNAAPGSVAPDETGPYGPYAQALTEMLREGGLPLDEAFARVRLRVSEQTKGAQVPWDDSKLSPAPALFARAPGAPPPAVALETQANLRVRPIRDFPVAEAYAAALERDTMAGYEEFLNAYPNTALAGRVRAMLALRREALTWRQACQVNSPPAYWTYLHRYRRGPHVEDARRRLILINAAVEPPPRYDYYEFDAPPPVEHDDFYINRPFVVFDDADYGPPPPMVMLLPPRPDVIYDAPPPPRPPYAGLLPLPVIAAPLLFALPAVRAGLFHAPSAVVSQQPAANDYYSNRYAHPPAPGGAYGAGPAGAPQPAPAPGAAPAGRPQPGAAQNAAPAAVAPVPAGGSPAAPTNHALPHGAPPAAAPAAPPAAVPGAAPANHALPHVTPPGAAPSVTAPAPAAVAPVPVAPAAGGASPAAPANHALPHVTPPAAAPNVTPSGANAPVSPVPPATGAGAAGHALPHATPGANGGPAPSAAPSAAPGAAARPAGNAAAPHAPAGNAGPSTAPAAPAPIPAMPKPAAAPAAVHAPAPHAPPATPSPQAAPHPAAAQPAAPQPHIAPPQAAAPHVAPPPHEAPAAHAAPPPHIAPPQAAAPHAPQATPPHAPPPQAAPHPAAPPAAHPQGGGHHCGGPGEPPCH